MKINKLEYRYIDIVYSLVREVSGWDEMLHKLYCLDDKVDSSYHIAPTVASDQSVKLGGPFLLDNGCGKTRMLNSHDKSSWIRSFVFCCMHTICSIMTELIPGQR